MQQNEVVAYCAACRKYLLKTLWRFDTFSDAFSLETRKLWIQHYPIVKPGTKYIVYVNIGVSE